MSEDCIKSIEPHLLGKRPNTYTYTKALAENILLAERGNLPVAIVRPSIVGPTWKEPVQVTRILFLYFFRFFSLLY